MADLYLGGGRRRRSAGADVYLLVIAVVACTWAFFKLAPRAGGTWETTASQVMKKQPTVVVYHPASDRGVLHALPDVPLLMVSAPQHFEFSGLQRVLFYSDTVEPAAMVDNLFNVAEIRDFAGKAMSVLDLPDRSLVADFTDNKRFSVFREEPPGVMPCERKAGGIDCAQDGRVSLTYENVGGSEVRCLKVEPSRDEPLTLVWSHGGELRLKHARVYVAWPDSVPAHGKMTGEVRVDGRFQGLLPDAGRQHFSHLDLQAFSAQTIELTVFANEPVCVDLEVMR